MIPIIFIYEALIHILVVLCNNYGEYIIEIKIEITKSF